MFYLQSRWKEVGGKLFYYGLQNRNHLFKNEIKLNKKKLAIVRSLPKELNEQESKILSKLLSIGVVVKEEQIRKIPKSII